jgi:rhamnogalacturonan endolyase
MHFPMIVPLCKRGCRFESRAPPVRSESFGDIKVIGFSLFIQNQSHFQVILKGKPFLSEKRVFMGRYAISKPVFRLIAASCSLILFAGPTSAQRFVEKLDRGLIAVKTGTGVFLSWRLFGTDPQDNSFGFNVYKGAVKLTATPITDATCYQDNSSAAAGNYTVRPVSGGGEGAPSEEALILEQNYLKIPLSLPSGYSAGDASCGDLDADGQYEVVLKLEKNPQDNANAGTTSSPILDAYKLSGTRMWRIDLGVNIREGAHYTQFMVYDLNGDGVAEVACKTAPGSRDGSGGYLKRGPAASADHTKDYRNGDGYILDGPEYYTVFAGKTGTELVTVDYKPPRGTLSKWGDTYGNRMDRFLACVAYLDGKRPSLIPCRGYYTRTTLWALDFRNNELSERWFFDSDVSGNSKYAGQGNHNLSVGDLDQDGFDEIEYGACAIDHNGKGLYSTGLGHGDAGHLGDLDPDRPGQEYFQCHEGGSGISFRDAKTGQIIWQQKASDDVGRGCADHLSASIKGAICWGNGSFTCTGDPVSSTPSSCNFLCWWDGDLQRELLNGNAVSKYGGSALLTASGCSSINGTKSTPCLSADLFGDWREEVIFKTTNSSELRIYTTTTPTTNRLYTLMHDPQYRCAIAWQNVAYNQPPHPGFYIGAGMTLPQEKPNIAYYDGTSLTRDITCKNKALRNKPKEVTKTYASCPIVISQPCKAMVIYSVTGRVIKRIPTPKTVMHLSEYFGLPDGMYLVKMFQP